VSLRDYCKTRDRFELDPVFNGFCGLCKRFGNDRSIEPCRSCDHNANATPAPDPVRECGTCGTHHEMQCLGHVYRTCKNWTPKSGGKDGVGKQRT
jgi:hypothetical protein